MHHFHPSHGIHRCTGSPSGWGLIGEAIAACGVFTPLGATTWRTADLHLKGGKEH